MIKDPNVKYQGHQNRKVKQGQILLSQGTVQQLLHALKAILEMKRVPAAESHCQGVPYAYLTWVRYLV